MDYGFEVIWQNDEGEGATEPAQYLIDAVSLAQEMMVEQGARTVTIHKVDPEDESDW